MGYANIKRQNNQTTTQTAARAGMSNASPAVATFPKFFSPMQDETLVLVAHPSAMNYIWIIVFGVLLIPLFLIGVAMILYAYIIIKTTCYVVTNRRVMVKTGLLSIKQSEVRIVDIRGVNLQRGLWQRIIGTGDITIGTAATGGAEIVICGVGNPRHIVDVINSQRQN